MTDKYASQKTYVKTVIQINGNVLFTSKSLIYNRDIDNMLELHKVYSYGQQHALNGQD